MLYLFLSYRNSVIMSAGVDSDTSVQVAVRYFMKILLVEFKNFNLLTQLFILETRALSWVYW